MFELSDFNVHGSLYWVRILSASKIGNNQHFFVYTKLKIAKIENEEICCWITSNKGVSNLWRITKEEYQNSSKESSFIVPDYIYETIKYQEISFPQNLSQKQFLSYTMRTTGNLKLDEIIKQVECSFKEFHEIFLRTVKL